MKKNKIKNRILSLLLALMMLQPLAVQNAYADTAYHSNGSGAGGADYCTIYNYYYNQNTRFGPNVASHLLTYNGVTHDAFCMNPYLNNGGTYSSIGYYNRGYGADWSAAFKYISMYNDGYPSGYSDQQRKIAVQLAIFDTSQMGIDYGPDSGKNHWYDVMFGGSVYRYALETLWEEAESYSMPPISASLDAPQNITNVGLTYNSSTNRYEARVYAGSVAQYYSWSGYASRSGNYINFSVPASDVQSWTGTYNGKPAYTSNYISGTGPSTRVSLPTFWQAGSEYQVLLTMEFSTVRPTNQVQYSLYVTQGMDEGRPGGGGGLYGGSISTDSAVAGGGSGYVGSGNGITGGSTMDGSNVTVPVPDGSNNGYARIVLVN